MGSSVFKTDGTSREGAFGGFDSRALPLAVRRGSDRGEGLDRAGCPRVAPTAVDRVQDADRLSVHVRAQVRVPERHVDGGVAHQLLNGLQGHTPHHQVAGERVAEGMHAYLPQTCPFTRPLERPPDLALCEHAPILGAEHQGPAKVTVRPVSVKSTISVLTRTRT